PLQPRPAPPPLWPRPPARLPPSPFFVFSPPIWPPLLLVVCAAIFDLRWRARNSPAAALRAALPSIVLVGCGVALAIAYYAPFLAVIAHTVYPGRRLAEAGGLPFGRLLDLLWPSLRVYAPFTDPSVVLGREKLNECEASAVEALPVFLGSALAAV